MTTEFKLSFQRHSALTPSQIWQGWTDRETLLKWFTPAPWKTIDAEIDLRAGGKFFTHMQGPEGESFQGTGCILLAEANKRLVWTSFLGENFVPNQIEGEGAFGFTAEIRLEPKANGTLYQASVFHANETDMNTHSNMGFEQGWNAAFDQLEALFE